MATMIQLLDNNIARDAAIQKVSIRIGIPEADFRRQVVRVSKAAAQAGAGKGKEGAAKVVDDELPPPDKHARQLIRLAVASAEVLEFVRVHAKLEMLAAVPGCQLLELIFKSQADISVSGGLTSFLATLTPAEERAFSRIVAEPPQRVSVESARHTLELIEFQGVEILLQKTATQLRQTGLPPAEVERLLAETTRLGQELRDRRTRLPHQSLP
jgi:DNA primase